MKTLIHVWTNEAYNIKMNKNDTTSYWGLGDLLRGTIKLYQIAKKHNYNYIVDIQLHPISSFLVNKKHEYSDFILQQKDKVFFIEDSEPYIVESKKDIVFLVSRDGYKNMDPITQDCKDFMKKFLTPNEDFEKFFQEKRKIIKDEKYNILHFRLGDECLVKKEGKGFSSYLPLVKKNKEPNDILLSDNRKFKKFVDIYEKVFYFDFDLAHVGFHESTDSIKNTIFEFFLLIRSSKIKTFSVYCWTSGFVNWAHIIYDIPLFKI